VKPERLATLVANIKPNDLAPGESAAFDFSYALVRGGNLPEPLYRLAVKTFGQHGTNELIYLGGLYALVSTTVNSFNVPVPHRPPSRHGRRSAAFGGKGFCNCSASSVGAEQQLEVRTDSRSTAA
jgi:hypothetical protein